MLVRQLWPLLTFIASVGGRCQERKLQFRGESLFSWKELPESGKGFASAELPVVCSNEGCMIVFQKAISIGWKAGQRDL